MRAGRRCRRGPIAPRPPAPLSPTDRRRLASRGLLLVVLATVGWSPLAAVLGGLGAVGWLWPGIGLMALGAVLAASGERLRHRAGGWVSGLGTATTLVGLLVFVAASASAVPTLWWMHPAQRFPDLLEWLRRSWQPALVLLPLLLGGLAQLLVAATGRGVVAARAGAALTSAVMALSLAAQSALLRPWRVSGVSMHAPAWTVDPEMVPSELAAGLGVVLAVALVVGLWASPARPSPQGGWLRRRDRTGVELRLPARGPALRARTGVRRDGVLALLLAAVGAFHLTFPIMAVGLALVAVFAAVDLLSVLVGRGRQQTRVVITPTGATVESTGWLRSERRQVERRALKLAVHRTSEGPVLAVSDDVIVLADVDPEDLARVLASVRVALVPETEADVVAARLALGGVGSSPLPTRPLLLPGVRRGVLVGLELPALAMLGAVVSLEGGALAGQVAQGLVGLTTLSALGAMLRRWLSTRSGSVRSLPTVDVPTEDDALERAPDENASTTDRPRVRPRVEAG